MEMLKYTFHHVVVEKDADGNIVEREVFLEKSVPATDEGRAIAEKEAYKGVITPYDDGEPEPEKEPTADDLLNALLGVSDDE